MVTSTHGKLVIKLKMVFLAGLSAKSFFTGLAVGVHNFANAYADVSSVGDATAVR